MCFNFHCKPFAQIYITPNYLLPLLVSIDPHTLCNITKVILCVFSYKITGMVQLQITLL